VRKDAMDLEEQISKAEAEKTNRDHAMRSLNDEISGLDELISKLNKEKKFFQVADLPIKTK
jgi:myosin heavy chain 6/7